jgi:hypothetical protein
MVLYEPLRLKQYSLNLHQLMQLVQLANKTLQSNAVTAIGKVNITTSIIEACSLGYHWSMLLHE